VFRVATAMPRDAATAAIMASAGLLTWRPILFLAPPLRRVQNPANQVLQVTSSLVGRQLPQIVQLGLLAAGVRRPPRRPSAGIQIPVQPGSQDRIAVWHGHADQHARHSQDGPAPVGHSPRGTLAGARAAVPLRGMAHRAGHRQKELHKSHDYLPAGGRPGATGPQRRGVPARAAPDSGPQVSSRQFLADADRRTRVPSPFMVIRGSGVRGWWRLCGAVVR
jgi:hypothetical protein